MSLIILKCVAMLGSLAIKNGDLGSIHRSQ